MSNESRLAAMQEPSLEVKIKNQKQEIARLKLENQMLRNQRNKSVEKTILQMDKRYHNEVELHISELDAEITEAISKLGKG